MFLIGGFYLLTTFIGFGARGVLGEAGVEAAGTGGNLAAPNLAQELGGGAGTFGGDLFLAVIAARRVRDDPRGGRGARALGVGRGRARRLVEHHPQGPGLRAARRSGSRKIAAASIGAIAILIAVIGGEGLNVSFMVGLAFAVAASANFPALLLALTWRRFNTTGAVCGVLLGVVSVDRADHRLARRCGRAPDGDTGSPSAGRLANPGIISIPLGFLGCWLGHDAEHGAGDRALVPRAVRPVGDRPGRREGARRAS